MSSSNQAGVFESRPNERGKNSPKMKSTLLREHKVLECQKRDRKKKKMNMENIWSLTLTSTTQSKLFRDGLAIWFLYVYPEHRTRLENGYNRE